MFKHNLDCVSSNHKSSKNLRQTEHTLLSTPGQPSFPKLAFSSTYKDHRYQTSQIKSHYFLYAMFYRKAFGYEIAGKLDINTG